MTLAALPNVIEKVDEKNRPSRESSEEDDARLVAAVHDEIVPAASAEDTPRIKVWVEEALVAGMERLFSGAATEGLVEASIGQSWAEK